MSAWLKNYTQPQGVLGHSIEDLRERKWGLLRLSTADTDMLHAIP